MPELAALDLPTWFIPVIVGAYGLVLGSFLNVVIHRVPRELSVFFPRSACPLCGRLIRWYENVPVLSWLMLRGRCAGCRNPISWRYPAVEILTALVLLLALERFGANAGFLIASLFLLLLLALIFIDLELMLLPDAITLPGTFVGLALSFVSPFTTPADALLGALLGLITIESLNLAYKLLRGRDGMGAGDTKMMMMMGAFLGWQDVVVGLVLASLIGTIVALPALAIARLAKRPRMPPARIQEDEPSEPDREQDPPPARTSALLDLVPRTRQELLAMLTVLALAATLIVDGLSPARSLGACLAGILLLAVATRVFPRAEPVAAWFPLIGALAGVPPTLPSLMLTAGVMVTMGLTMALLGSRLPASDPLSPAEDAGAPAETFATDSPTLLQASIPFGVFLGIAGALSLLAGDDILDWYLSFAARLLGPA